MYEPTTPPTYNESTELELQVYDGRVYLTMMIDNLNKMCGTGQRPTLAQLQVIRDTLEHVRYNLLTSTPFDFRIIP